MNPAIRVLLVDDHHLVRAGMKLLLESMEGVEIQVVAAAHDGREAFDLARTHHPDLVLMDVAMAGLNGLDATVMLKKEKPDVRILMLSMHASEEHVLQALRAGASGYLVKDSSPAELERAIRTVMSGEIHLSAPVSKRIIGAYVQRVTKGRNRAEPLTHRQREILQLIAEGGTTKEIAQRLGVSIKTVESHRAQVMARLNIHDVPGLVRYAIRVGLVGSDA